MASLRDIRTRINAVKSTQQVTRAMKMVAASKLRRAQEQIFRTRPYAYKIADIINHLRGHVDPSLHPLFQAREESDSVLLVVVTADRGLAGAFNSNIIRVAEQAVRDRFQSKRDEGKLYVMGLGRKGREHFARRDYQMVGEFKGIYDSLSIQSVQEIMSEIVDGYEEGRWDEVFVVYNEFRNTIAQNRVLEPFLPIPTERFLTPVMAEEVEHVAEIREGRQVDYLFEPDAHRILEELVPRYLNFVLWRILLESNAAEQGARMVAMDNATSNADDLLRDLRLKYNRARQDAITKEIIEITSGAEALGG